jgi:hypothetical protein
MKNFRKNIDKKVWGVLGKQQTYYSPNQFVGERVPLNANPLEAWDTKRSRYKRVDLVPKQNDGQQAGVVPEASSSVVVVTPTPTPTITQTNTPTPSFTPTQTETNTPTPTLTPSSTPFNLPSTPDLWYDSTNIGSIDYITSGGTDYVSGWRSVGTYSKTLTGTTTDTMPVWSASTLFPGNPKIIRFNKSATAGLRDFLTQRFDSTVITGAGITIFTVIAKPSILDYTTATGINGFGLQFNLYSGNTTTGGFTPISFAPPRNISQSIGSGNNTMNFQSQNSGVTVTNTYTYSATNLNDKFLFTQAMPFPTGFPYFEINQSGGTLTNAITGTPVTTFNSFNLGATVVSGGTLTASNSGCELAEIMIYTRELTVQQQEAVQNYLRDKWRYDEWASPVPTPTQTASPTQTTTQTTTPTPSPTPPPFSPSGLTDLEYWFMGASGSSVSSWTNYGLLGGSLTQGTGARQPDIITGATLGSYTGTAVQFLTRDFMNGTFTTRDFSANTVFFVGKMQNQASQSGIYVVSSLPVSSTAFEYQNYSQIYRIGLNPSLYQISSTSATTLGGAAQIMCASGNTSAFEAQVLTGAGVIAPTSSSYTNATSVSALQFGLDTGGGANIDLQIHEYIMYDRKLSSTEYNNVINYLKTKYQFNTW